MRVYYVGQWVLDSIIHRLFFSKDVSLTDLNIPMLISVRKFTLFSNYRWFDNPQNPKDAYVSIPRASACIASHRKGLCKWNQGIHLKEGNTAPFECPELVM